MLKNLSTAVIIKIIVGFVSLSLLISTAYYFKKLLEVKGENERLTYNIETLNKDVETYKSDDGKLVSSINALTVKQNELMMYNQKLVEEVKGMGLKIKNLQSVSKVDYGYEVKYDTIKDTLKPKSVKIADNRYKYSFNDGDYLKFNTDVVLPNIDSDSIIFNGKEVLIKQNLNPKFENFMLTLADSLLIVPEYQYKRNWIFWKKLNGLKLHIKSQNPYMKIDKIESYQISK